GGMWQCSPVAGVAESLDVVRRVRKTGAEGADDVLQAVVEFLVRRVYLGEAAAGHLDVLHQLALVDADDPAVVDHNPAADHHLVDAGALFSVDDLVGGVVERQPVGGTEVEEDDVGLVAGLDPAELLEAESPGAAD